jgi:squalene synthase HpnC
LADGEFLIPAQFIASPEAMQRIWTPADAARYTRWLATRHYENFHVVSFLLPRELHQDFYNVYAFCRWADDLGDEIGDARKSLQWLSWWRQELVGMYAGRASHPVFIALAQTVERRRLPSEPFSDLITAFEQDQRVTRYRNWEELLQYCRYSANPVGRLLLYLCGYRDPMRQELSDATCTALQLANHWQDVAVDLEKDRVYIPLDIMARYGYSLDELYARRFTPQFAALMRDIVNRARDLFLRGLPLAGTVRGRLAIDLELFSRGGMRVLEKIEQQNYDVLSRRPAISKIERVRILLSVLLRRGFAKAAA